MRPCRRPVNSEVESFVLPKIFQTSAVARFCKIHHRQNRVTADVWNIFGRTKDSTSEFTGLLHGRIAVVHREIRYPVWRYRTHLGRDLIHAADALTIVFEHGVFHRPRKNFSFPTKQRRVEVAGFLTVSGAEFVPAQRARFSISGCARVLLRLPEGKRGFGWILNDSHTAIRTDVKRFFHRAAARGDRLGCSIIGVRDGDITEPMRWESLLKHLARQLIKTADIFTVKLDDRVDTGWSHRLVVVVPTEKLLVKIFRAIDIGGAELYPTETARFDFREFLPSYFAHYYGSSSVVVIQLCACG